MNTERNPAGIQLPPQMVGVTIMIVVVVHGQRQRAIDLPVTGASHTHPLPVEHAAESVTVP